MADISSEKCFHKGCTNLPIVADVNFSYGAKSPNSTLGVIFNLNYIVDRGCNVYGSACLLALRVETLLGCVGTHFAKMTRTGPVFAGPSSA